MTDLPVHASDRSSPCGSTPWVILSAALAFAAAVLVHALTAKLLGQTAARWALLAPLGCAIWLGWAEIRLFRKLDELQVRIFFEALACASLFTMLTAMIWPSLQITGLVGQFSPAYVAGGLPIAFLVAYGFSARRYA